MRRTSKCELRLRATIRLSAKGARGLLGVLTGNIAGALGRNVLLLTIDPNVPRGNTRKGGEDWMRGAPRQIVRGRTGGGAIGNGDGKNLLVALEMAETILMICGSKRRGEADSITLDRRGGRKNRIRSKQPTN